MRDERRRGREGEREREREREMREKDRSQLFSPLLLKFCCRFPLFL
jgi:hypothetical protein